MAKKPRITIGDFFFDEESREAIEDIIRTNELSEGRRCREFESEIAKYIGTTHAVVCNSGTSAIMLILQALKYHSKYRFPFQGAKALTPALTYIATANAIATTNYEPVFIDIKKEDFCIDENLMAEHLESQKDTSDYKTIVPVHLMGYPCNMKKINALAKKYDLFVLEDSCEAFGSDYNGKRTGNLADAGVFSFYLAHNIQIGECGAISTNDQELADRCNRLKGNGRLCYCTVDDIHHGRCPHQNLGFHPRYLHDMIGYNFKSMEYQGAIGKVQMKKIAWIKERRQENVKYLNDGLAGLEGKLQLPRHDKGISYLGYPLLVLDPKISRNKIAVHLTKENIENRPVFNSIPTQQPAYAHFKKQYESKVPNAEYVGNNAFYVGCHQFLEESQLDIIIREIKNACKQ